MAIYRPAIQKLIPPGPNDPRLNVVVGTVGHVAVSEADSLYNWFKTGSGGVESHFYIRYDGTVEQYRDTAYEADAQGAGNSWVIGSQRYGYVSYETEGMGSGKWTSAQLTSIKALIKWVNETHGSPWQKTPAYHGRGHGYHSLFPEWNPNGHTCPGPDRIQQFNTIIVPWLADGGKEYEVISDADLDRIAEAVVNKPVPRPGNTPVALGNQVGGANINAYRALQILKTIADPAKLAAAILPGLVAALPDAEVVTDAQLEAALRKVLGSLDE